MCNTFLGSLGVAHWVHSVYFFAKFKLAGSEWHWIVLRTVAYGTFYEFFLICTIYFSFWNHTLDIARNHHPLESIWILILVVVEVLVLPMHQQHRSYSEHHQAVLTLIFCLCDLFSDDIEVPAYGQKPANEWNFSVQRLFRTNRIFDKSKMFYKCVWGHISLNTR